KGKIRVRHLACYGRNVCIVTGVTTSRVEGWDWIFRPGPELTLVIVGVLPGIAHVDAVGARKMKRLGDVTIDAFGVRLIGFENADTLCVERTTLPWQTVNLRVVRNLVHVRRGGLREVVPAPCEGGIHEHGTSEGAVVAGGPLPCAIVPLRIRRGV